MLKFFVGSLVALSISCAYVVTGFADCSTTICTGKIERLYFNGSTLYISTSGDESNLNCTSPASVYVTLSTDDTDFDRKYAMLLTAYAGDKTAGLRIVEGSSACSLSYIYVDR